MSVREIESRNVIPEDESSPQPKPVENLGCIEISSSDTELSNERGHRRQLKCDDEDTVMVDLTEMSSTDFDGDVSIA